MYFNTNNINGNELLKAINSAKNQNETVYNIFKILDREISPTQLEDIYLKYTGKRIPRSSVARSLSTLTDDGRLIKTEKQILSRYNRKEYLWKVNA